MYCKVQEDMGSYIQYLQYRVIDNPIYPLGYNWKVIHYTIYNTSIRIVVQYVKYRKTWAHIFMLYLDNPIPSGLLLRRDVFQGHPASTQRPLGTPFTQIGFSCLANLYQGYHHHHHPHPHPRKMGAEQGCCMCGSYVIEYIGKLLYYCTYYGYMCCGLKGNLCMTQQYICQNLLKRTELYNFKLLYLCNTA